MLTFLLFAISLAVSLWVDRRAQYSTKGWAPTKSEFRGLEARVRDLEQWPIPATALEHKALELRVVELETWKNGRKRRPRTIVPPPSATSSVPPAVPPAPATPRGVS